MRHVESFAYLDEADAEPTLARPGLYLVAAAIIEPAHLTQCEALLRALVREEDVDSKGHRRLHLSRIKDRHRKHELAALLASLRGTRFAVGWTSGYADPKSRERIRAKILWEFLPHLAAKEDAGGILLEQREDAKLRAADARTIGRLRDGGFLDLTLPVDQAPASTAPGLWMADAAAAAWRRDLVEGKDNWSRWYAPHTNLIEVTCRP
ncbi:hypothetical protein [Actinoallomurus acanthiterrae]